MSTEFIEYPAIPQRREFSWSGIFGGTFLFLAIEAVFGTLAMAIFGRVRPLAAGAGSSQIGIGAGIWMIILSIIAMYFAGNLAAKLSGSYTRNSGMYAGLVTFGMAVFSVILIAEIALGSPIGGVGAGMAATTHLANVLAANGWYFFVGLILSMVSAGCGGGYGTSTSRRMQRPPVERPIEPRKAA